jgi:hypothetical protein
MGDGAADDADISHGIIKKSKAECSEIRIMVSCLYPPRASHRLIDKSIGLFIVDKRLSDGVKLQRPLDLQRDFAQVHQRAASVAVKLIQCKRFSLTHGLSKIGQLRLGLGKLRQFGVHIGNIRADRKSVV